MRELFPDPPVPDETWPQWGETTVAWLRRSTLPNAQAMRDFLNRTLTHFPPKHASSVAKKLNHDWHSSFFELVVGRYLQTLGADVVHEPVGTNATRVDYRATFPSAPPISVECVSKRFNQAARLTIELHANMRELLDEIGPVGWVIIMVHLPEAKSPDDFRPYVDQARQFYATLPEPTTESPQQDFVWSGPVGRMELQVKPFPRGTRPNHLGPAVAYFDNSIPRLRSALIDSHKRRQALGAIPPVFLAIDSPVSGPDAEQFDQALFGQTADHWDMRTQRSVGTSFDPTGLFVTDRAIPFAGVLAFLRLSPTGGTDPVLYLNPYQRWRLPAEIAGLETRTWTSRIDRAAAAGHPSMQKIRFVEYPPKD